MNLLFRKIATDILVLACNKNIHFISTKSNKIKKCFQQQT